MKVMSKLMMVRIKRIPVFASIVTIFIHFCFIGLELFQKMYNDLPHKGDGNLYSGSLDTGLQYEGAMGDSGSTIIYVKIQNRKTIREIKSNSRGSFQDDRNMINLSSENLMQ